MGWIRSRPLAFFAACYAAGLAVGVAVGVPGLYALGAAAAVALVFCAFPRTGILFAAAFLAGAGMIGLWTDAPGLPESGGYQVEATVVTAQVRADGRCRALVEDATLDGAKQPGRMLLYIKDWQGNAPLRGSRLSLPAFVYPSAQDGAVSPMSWRGYTVRMGAYLGATGRFDGLEVVDEGSWSPLRVLDGVRAFLAGRVEEMYPQPVAELVKSLTLGIRGDLPEEVSGAFSSAGVVHLLALSGLHVSALAMLLERLLRRLPVSPRAAFGGVLTALVLYMLLVGAPASMARAVVMYAVTGVGRLRRRPTDSLTSLAAAFLALTLFTPRQALDPGLLLSFASLLGILCLAPLGDKAPVARLPEKVRGLARKAASALLASLGASLATLPLVVGMYGKIHPYGILANLLLIPLSAAALPAAFVSLGLGAAWLPLGKIAAFIARWPLEGIMAFVGRVAALPGASVSLRSWNGYLTPLLAACLFLASPYVHPPRKSGPARFAALGCAMAVAFLAGGLPEVAASPVSVMFLDVGQGDGALLRAEGHAYLIDAGGDETCAAYLKEENIVLDGMFLTHPHDDHAGGAQAALRRQTGTLYVPEGWESMEADGDLDGLPDLARELGWQVVYLALGDVVPLSEHVEAETLWPAAGLTDPDANRRCLALWVRYGRADALFLGDKPAGLEFETPDVELLKVAHHGAANGTNALTAAMSTPGVAVISVGYNSYGHPNPGVIRLLEDCGAEVLRTDRDGNVLVEMYEDGTMRYWVYPE